MARSTSLLARAVLTGVVVGGALSGSGTAGARPIAHETFEDSWSDEIDCDGLITLRIEGQEHGRFLLVERGPDGLWYGQAVLSGTSTVTNPDNGKTFTFRWQNLDKDRHVVDNGDGTVTIDIMLVGSTLASGPNGVPRFVDTGLFQFEIVYDIVADEEIGWEFIRFVGHSETGDRDFCQDMAEFLG